MEQRLTISPAGGVQIESISILEDLWHDYQYFRVRAAETEKVDIFIAKRYYRAAFIILAFYAEGVTNRWLKPLIEPSKWEKTEKKKLQHKMEVLDRHLNLQPPDRTTLDNLRKLRNKLAHLKPGFDIDIYDSINAETLTATESDLAAWIKQVEEIVGLERHDNSQSFGRRTQEALGTAVCSSEKYSGDSIGETAS